MKTVTYLIGNGYDIQLGLKTSYKDFYNWLKEQKDFNQDNMIYRSIMASAKTNYDKWSDFELALGEYTKEKGKLLAVSPMRERFWDAYDDILEHLGRYLESESQRLSAKTLHDSIIDNLRNPFSGMGMGKGYSELNLQKLGAESYEVNLLTFNYTNTLSWFDEWQDKIYNPNSFGDIYKGSYVACHGTLNSNMVLGVNDEEQLSDVFPYEEKNDLIKYQVLAGLGEKTKENTIDIISKSDVIILFGVSLGQTDKYLWKAIIDAILNNDTNVIIHKFDPTISGRNPRIKKQKMREIVKIFMAYADSLSEEQQELVTNKLFVVFNQELFNYNREEQAE